MSQGIRAAGGKLGVLAGGEIDHVQIVVPHRRQAVAVRRQARRDPASARARAWFRRRARPSVERWSAWDTRYDAAVLAEGEIGDARQRHARTFAPGLFLDAEVLGRGGGGRQGPLGMRLQVIGIETQARIPRAAAQVEHRLAIRRWHRPVRPGPG